MSDRYKHHDKDEISQGTEDEVNIDTHGRHIDKWGYVDDGEHAVIIGITEVDNETVELLKYYAENGKVVLRDATTLRGGNVPVKSPKEVVHRRILKRPEEDIEDARACWDGVPKSPRL